MQFTHLLVIVISVFLWQKISSFLHQLNRCGTKTSVPNLLFVICYTLNLTIFYLRLLLKMYLPFFHLLSVVLPYFAFKDPNFFSTVFCTNYKCRSRRTPIPEMCIDFGWAKKIQFQKCVRSRFVTARRISISFFFFCPPELFLAFFLLLRPEKKHRRNNKGDRNAPDRQTDACWDSGFGNWEEFLLLQML